MPKAIKVIVRKLIFTMIGKYQDIKLDNERIQNEKIHRLDEILTAVESDMARVKTLVKELKCLEEKEAFNSETKYLDTISIMTALERFIINVRDDSDSSFSGIEFLESDFDYES
ncbi:hypothetical protein ACJJTC_001064 [Scirpophaga incertulas]